MRSPRDDYPGASCLITNRGIAKRAVFETRLDVEHFSAALARVVALGLVEVDAFAFLTTHFHLLLRRLTGEISLAMKLVTNELVRWFNRARKRDGPLFAGRFDGRRIDDGASGLLRFAAGRTLPEIADDLGVAISTVHFALRRHAAWMDASPRYADVVARALQNAMRRTLPPRRSPLHLPPLVRA